MSVTFVDAGERECGVCAEVRPVRGHTALNSRGVALEGLVDQVCSTCLAQLVRCPFCRTDIEGAARPIVARVGVVAAGQAEDLVGPRRHAASFRRQEFY